MNFKKSIIILGLVFFANCLGTEVGNPPATESEDLKIDFVVQIEDNAGIGNISLSEDINIEEAVIIVSALRFRKCDLGENQAFKSQSFLAELLREKHIDSSVLIERGDYCRLDIEPLLGGKDGKFGGRPELEGFVLYAKGTYQNTPQTIFNVVQKLRLVRKQRC